MAHTTNSIRSEIALLGSLMADPNRVGEATSLRPEQLANEHHQEIFRLMRSLASAGSWDPMLLTETMMERNFDDDTIKIASSLEDWQLDNKPLEKRG